MLRKTRIDVCLCLLDVVHAETCAVMLKQCIYFAAHGCHLFFVRGLHAYPSCKVWLVRLVTHTLASERANGRDRRRVAVWLKRGAYKDHVDPLRNHIHVRTGTRQRDALRGVASHSSHASTRAGSCGGCAQWLPATLDFLAPFSPPVPFHTATMDIGKYVCGVGCMGLVPMHSTW